MVSRADGWSRKAARPVPWRNVLLPRNRSVWVKWCYLPLGAAAAVGVGAGPVPPGTALELLLLWFVAEQLGYQARYLVNDLRDREVDAAHPASGRRRRLPAGLAPPHVALLRASVVVRLVLAGVLTLLLTGPVREAAVGFLLGLAVLTVGYEVGRDRVRRADVAPAGPGALVLSLPVLTAVPLGYGLRVGAGYHAAAPDGLDVFGVLLVVAVVLLQTGTVLLAWTLEGTAFLESFPCSPRYHRHLHGLAHVGVLLVHAGALDRTALPHPAHASPRAGAPTSAVVARDRPAAGASDVRVWDVASAAALAVSGLAVAVAVDRPLAPLVLLPGAVLVAAPWIARAWTTPRRAGPSTWLGGGALPLCLTVELGAVLGVAVLLLVIAPSSVWLALVPAVVLLQWASVRASSWDVGVGPRSAVSALAGYGRRR